MKKQAKPAKASAKRRVFHLHCKPNKIDPSIEKYAQDRFCKSVDLVKVGKYSKYKFFHSGTEHTSGGLLTLLERTFYSHYQTNRSRRNHKHVMVRGSNDSKGKTVDRQISAWTSLGGAGQRPKRLNKLAASLMKHLEDLGHSPQAAQLPVLIPNTRPYRVTQADLITKDGFNRLWLWEIKTGFPVGGFRKQDVFQHGIVDKNGDAVPCTKYNIWQLQLHFTRQALESAGIEIAEARVIQVHEVKNKAEPQIKIHAQPEWVKSARL